MILLNILVQWYFSLEIEGRATRTGWIHVALRNTLPARSTVITENGRLAWRSKALSSSLSDGIVYCTEGMTEAGPVRSGGPPADLIYTGQPQDCHLTHTHHIPVRNHFQLIYS